MSDDEMDNGDAIIGSDGSWVSIIMIAFVVVWSSGVLCMICAACTGLCCLNGGYASRLNGVDRKKIIESSVITKVRIKSASPLFIG